MKILRQNIFFIGCLILFLGFCNAVSAMVVVGGEDRGQQSSIAGIEGEMQGTKQAQQYVQGEVLVKFKEGSDSHEVLKKIGLESYKIERTHSIKPAVSKFLKDYELKKDSGGWYWFRGKQYEDVANIDEEELFREAYEKMSPIKQGLYRTYKLTLLEGTSVPEAIAKLKNDPNVEYAEPNYIIEMQMTPSDALFNKQWALNNTGQPCPPYNLSGTPDCDIDAPEAWDIATGSIGIIVAVVDTGVDYNHRDLNNNMWNDGYGYCGYDFVNRDHYPLDDHGHGTHVAGIIAADDNGLDIVGVAPDAKIMALKILNAGGSGNITAAIAAFDYAVVNGAKIISNSWGGVGYSQALADTIDYTVSQGLVVIAAAGNNNSSSIFYPAGYTNVIAVAATDAKDSRPSFSNYGYWVDVAAPGHYILSLRAAGTSMGTIYNQYNTVASGTSMSCPHATGVAALLLEHKPGLTPLEIRRYIEQGCDIFGIDTGMPDKNIGAGRLNAFKALSLTSICDGTAEITAPTQSGNVEGVISITGTATDDNFLSYTLSYASPGKTWTDFYTSTVPRTGVLNPDGFDTTQLANGEFFVRLKVTDTNGNSTQQTVLVNVKNMILDSVRNNDVLRAGDIIPLEADLADFPGVTSYTIEYGSQSGINGPVGSWVPIVTNMPLPPVGNHLADWDTTSIATNGFYSIRTTLHRLGGDYVELISNLYLDKTLKNGWPHRVAARPDYFGNYSPGDVLPVVYDLDGDGNSEVVIYSSSIIPVLHVFDCNGALLWELPVAPEGDAAVNRVSALPVIADIDGDPEMEIIVLRPDYIRKPFAGDYLSKLYAFNHDGTLVANWPVDVSSNHTYPQEAVVFSAADMDLDSKDEIVLVWHYQPVEVSVIEGSGRVLAEWNISAHNTHGAPYMPYPAIGNLDQDDEPEIVIIRGDFLAPYTSDDYFTYVYAFERDGSPIFGPVEIEGLPKSPVIGDINNDSKNEIVVVTDYEKPSAYAFDNTGTQMWNAPMGSGLKSLSSPALGDLTMDGNLEIVVSCGTDERYVFDYNGQIVFPQPFIGKWYESYSVCIGDVSGDGRPNIISVTGNGFASPYYNARAWNMDNTMPAGFPMITEMQAEGAAIADIDNDGLVELISTSHMDKDHVLGESKKRFSIYVWDLDAPYDEATMFWPTFQHDTRRTGCYTPPIIPPNPPTKLTAKAISCAQINLIWSDNSNNENGFKIERGTDGISFSEIAGVGKNITTYNNTGLEPGTIYYYRVSAYNRNGKSNYSNTTEEVTLVSGNQPPTCSFIVIPNPYDRRMFTFRGTASDPDGRIVTFYWQLGDGHIRHGDPNFWYRYEKGGIYTVTLVVVDNDGAFSETATYTINIAPNTPPTCSITAIPHPSWPRVYKFIAVKYDKEGKVKYYYWDMGDGHKMEGPYFYYTYAAPGTYTVSLVVEDDEGAKSEVAVNTIGVK